MTDITLVFRIKIIPQIHKKAYIFSFCENGMNLYSYIENDTLFYGIMENDNLGIPNGEVVNFVCKKIKFKKLYNMSFSLNKSDGNLKLRLKIDDEIEEKSFSFNLKNGKCLIHNLFSIGSDFNNKNFGVFYLYEFMQYTSCLSEGELKQIYVYLSGKNYPSYIQFNGESFLYLDYNTNSLMQNDKRFQPDYITND